jgi:hypothetical protein
MGLKMSQSKYYLNNPQSPNLLSLRDALHRAFKQEEFIVEIPTEDDIIEISERNDKAKLKKIVINELNYSDDKSTVIRIWKIDLEKDLLGIATSAKKTECAILVLQRYESSDRLNVFLIELKSSLNNKTLTEIEEKFSSTMTRLYMLLVLNNHLNPSQGYNQKTIYIDFKGILFYKNSKFDNSIDGQLSSILQKPEKVGVLTCKTILRGEDKIKIKCFEIPTSDNPFTIKLQDLIG